MLMGLFYDLINNI